MKGRDLSGVHVKITHARGVERVEPKRRNISGEADNPVIKDTSWMKQLYASRPYVVGRRAMGCRAESIGRRASVAARSMSDLLEEAMPFLVRHCLRTRGAGIPVFASHCTDNARRVTQRTLLPGRPSLP